jgi:nucleoside-diphosphate-sugar epimerase
MRNKVLVTGASGFVGQNLTIHFDSENQYNFIPINLRIPFSISQLDKIITVIHLAGKAHDLNKVSDPDEYYQVNFKLTKQLYDAFLVSDAKKFIFISSVKAAADSVDGILYEDQTPNPKTHYGKSKLMAEEYIQSQPLPESKSYFILRPCMIHGPGNKGNLNLLYQLLVKGIPYPLAAFENKRSFLSVENLCFIIKELIKRDDIASGIYNVADDEPLSSNELIRTLSLALGKAPRLWRLPKSIIQSLAMIGDKLHLPLNSEKLQKLTENYLVSNEKIKLALGKNLPLTAHEGILKTARAFKNA